jgi:hypothetical protein
MKNRTILVLVCVVLSAFGFGRAGASPAPVLKPAAAAAVPLYFIANDGPADAKALFYIRIIPGTPYLIQSFA